MDVQQSGFIKSIVFATGKVAFLGYTDDWKNNDLPGDDPDEVRLAVVIREERPYMAAVEKWVYQIPCTCGWSLQKDSITFYVFFDDDEFPLNAGIKEVLRSLTSAGLLTRHQELAAYVAFDIAYSD
jgi:hypothetical protein